MILKVLSSMLNECLTNTIKFLKSSYIKIFIFFMYIAIVDIYAIAGMLYFGIQNDNCIKDYRKNVNKKLNLKALALFDSFSLLIIFYLLLYKIFDYFSISPPCSFEDKNIFDFYNCIKIIMYFVFLKPYIYFFEINCFSNFSFLLGNFIINTIYLVYVLVYYMICFYNYYKKHHKLVMEQMPINIV